MKRFVIVLLFAGCVGFESMQAQQTVSHTTNYYLQKHGEVYFKFSLSNRQQLQQLSRFISFDKVHSDTVFAYANSKGFTRFLKTGIHWSLLVPPSERLSRQKLLPKNTKNSESWDEYPSYEQYVSLMQKFQNKYPGLCHIVSIGKSVQGRDLLFAHIGHLDDTLHTVPEFMYTSTMHGDEPVGYVLMLHLIDYLLNNYGVKPEVTDLIDSVDLWINPLANPDGTYAGGNTSVYGATRFNGNHIDLNRNYPDPKDGQHPDGNDWQPETKAFMKFAAKHHFVMSCNMHTGSEVANYPWDTWSQRTADDNWWRKVCRQYADTVHTHAPAGYFTDLDNGITDGFDWYSITGGRQDYMNYFQHDREFTLELSHTKIPDPATLPNYWEYNYRSFMDYMHQVSDGLRGTVTDSILGKPLKAEIFIEDHDINHSQVYSDSVSGLYFRPVYPGTYNVRFSTSGFCSKTIKNVTITNGKPTILNVMLQAGSSDGIRHPKISTGPVYPNPAFDKIYCTDFSQGSLVSIINLSGKKVFFGKIGSGKVLDIRQLPSGIYFLKISSGRKTILKEFVKK